MKIIVVGDGKVGLAITAQLAREGHNLLVIDSDSGTLERRAEEYDVMVMHGNGASLPVLRTAEAHNADLLIAATSTDETNILTCIFAKQLGARHTIARVRNPEYSTEQLGMIRDGLGISMTVNPDLSAAEEVYHILQFPSFIARDTFARGRVEIVEIKIGRDSKLLDIPLKALYSIVDVKVLVCAVERKNTIYIPNGEFFLREGDNIYVTAATNDLVKLVNSLGIAKRKTKNVMLLGGSRIAYYLAAMLAKSGIGVKIIEKSKERCLELAELLPKAVIIHGDTDRQGLLLEEGIRETDALVTLTDLDEQNLFLSLYGVHVGVQTVITKVNQTEYAELIGDMGIESVISPKLLCATEIVRYARAMADTTGGSVITMHEMANGKAYALEFRATEKTSYLDTPLMQIPIRRSFLLACIIRDGKAIIPRGSDVIRQRDTVIVVSSSEEAVVDLNEIFED